MNELATKLIALSRQRHAIVERLLVPARAAASQMKDAGMSRGADPILQVLFEIDAIEQQIQDLSKTNPEQTLTALMEMLSHDNPNG